MQGVASIRRYLALDEDGWVPNEAINLRQQAQAYALLIFSSPAIVICAVILFVVDLSTPNPWSQLPLALGLPLAILCILLLASCVPSIKSIGGAIMVIVVSMALSQQSLHSETTAGWLYPCEVM